MARGTTDDFDELHSRTLRILNRMLEAAEKGMLVVGKDDEGNNLIGMPPPALLAQAIKFLQANGVDKPASGTNRKDTLKDAMPDLDAVEKGNVLAFKK